MYTNPPYQQYPLNNPYADNPRLVKSALARPPVIGMAVSLGIMLALMIYSLISTISASSVALNSLPSNYITSSYIAIYQTIITWVIIIQIICIAVYILPFIGLILMYIKSRNSSDTSSPKAGITLNFVFLIIFTVITSIFTLIILIASFAIISNISGQLNAYNRYGYNNPSVNNAVTMLYVILFLLIAYFVVMIIWSSSGIALCSSMKRTLRCEGLFTGGATTVCVTTILSMVIILAIFIIALSLGNSTLGNNGVKITLSTITANSIPSIISSVAMIMFNIFLIIFASSYKKTINNARVGQSYNNSTTTYYQSPYQGLMDNNMSNPPYNVQNNQPLNTYYANPQQSINNNPQPTVNTGNQINLNKPPVQNNTAPQTQNINSSFQPAVNTAAQINLNKTPVQSTSNIQTQSTENICSACGAKNKADSLFCQNCGSVLNSVQTQQSNIKQSTPQINLDKNTTQNDISSQTQNSEKTCSVCGTKNNSSSLFCQNCGNSLKVADIPQPTADTQTQINLDKSTFQSTEIICSACGAKNKPDSLFCQNCGTRLR